MLQTMDHPLLYTVIIMNNAMHTAGRLLESIRRPAVCTRPLGSVTRLAVCKP